MKTPDEIKKGLDTCIGDDERCANCSYVCYGDCRAALEVDALKYIQRLESAQPKWISVEERLPEPYKKVLTIREGFSETGRYIYSLDSTTLWIDNTLVWNGDLKTWKNRVTHWMPLPEAPKEG